MLRPKNKGVGPKPCFMAGCLSRGGSLNRLRIEMMPSRTPPLDLSDFSFAKRRGASYLGELVSSGKG
jgi:hypothetical protein